MAVQSDEKLNLKSKNNESKSKTNDQQDDSGGGGVVNNNKEDELMEEDTTTTTTTTTNDDKKAAAAAEDDESKKDEEKQQQQDDDDESEKEEDANALNANVGKKSFMGNTCSVRTLIDDNVLIPSDNALSFEFMGKTFYADLLPNGGIRWTENKQTFSTPSSWVNFCKRTMTTDYINKSISAWSTIKYEGKRLDSYKLRWYRKQKKNFSPFQNSNFSNSNAPHDDSLPFFFDATNKTTNTELLKSSLIYSKESLMSDFYFDEDRDEELDKKRNIVNHSSLPLKHLVGSGEPVRLSCNQLVRTESFSSIDRIQPFTLTISTHALLLIDFHCHLTSTEVVGYLAGSWDAAALNLNIMQAFPCRVRIEDAEKARQVQEEVVQSIRQRNLSLVGWYHNHFDRAAQPTVKDIECQLANQLTMCENEIQYLPSVSLICSPYDPYNKTYSSSLTAFWVLPPPTESRPLEYGKPLHLFYQTTRDSFLTQDLLLEMRLLAHFYMDSEDKINFNDAYTTANGVKKEGGGDDDDDEAATTVATVWEKFKYSIKPNLPSDLQVSNDLTVQQANLQQQALVQFWTFLNGLLIKNTVAASTTTTTTNSSTTTTTTTTAAAAADSSSTTPVLTDTNSMTTTTVSS